MYFNTRLEWGEIKGSINMSCKYRTNLSMTHLVVRERPRCKVVPMRYIKKKNEK